MLKRQVILTGTAWEEKAGYARAVRVGSIVEVAGTTAVNSAGEVIGEGDAAAQARFIFDKIRHALATAEAQLEHVTRTRIYLTDIRHWEAVGAVHGEVFGQIKPACTMLQVAALIDPRLLVEIEVSAFVDI